MRTGKNYIEVVTLIREVCLAHPYVQNFYRHKYRLNKTDDIDYAAVVLTVDSVEASVRTNTYHFNFMYVDRQTPERDNVDDIISVGITTLTEIVNALVSRFDFNLAADLSFSHFEHQFADEVAGVVTAVRLVIPSEISACEWLPCICPDC